MIVFPNCKINLGLHILNKRADGYHNLETVFYPVPLMDALEIITTNKNENASSTGVQFSSSGAIPEIPAEENTCLKAYRILKKDFPQLPAITMHLHKIIPSGAGLGGGSADGAFTLTLLNKKFCLNLSFEKLMQYALRLGSDCPFFILNKPCIATGRGEILKEIDLNLSPYKFLLVNPGITINTAHAFSNITPAIPDQPVKEIIRKPIESWKEHLTNNFEKTVFIKFPEIKSIKDNLYHSGAIYASLSGSGSSVFGIFRKEEIISYTFPEHYFIKELNCKLK